MKKDKILIIINNLKEIEDYKKIGITNFLFAVKDLSVGYNSFSLNEIPLDSYLLINRVLDTDGINLVKEIKNELLKFKGIIFEDVGVYHIFKEDDIELIWFQNHFGVSSSSINYWLKNVDSAVISNEITKEEIIYIVNNANKPLVFNVFGKNQIMYSRRTLLSNFNKYNKLDDYNNMELDVINNKCSFNALESEYGTIIYNKEYFNYIDFSEELNDSNIKYFLINNLDFTTFEIDEIINGKNIGDDGFLNKKSVYRLSEYTDR